MSLYDFYKTGDNAKLVPGILGLFWTRVFPEDNGLVSAVSATSGHTLDYGETYMRRLVGWLTGGTDDVDFVERLEVVPVDAVRREIIHTDEGHVVGGGAYIGAPSGSLRWVVPLSNEYADIPVVLPLGGRPLLKQADYIVDGSDLVFRENPVTLGMTAEIEDVDGLPSAAYRLLLAGCVPLNGGGDNFSFYKLPDNARRSMLDLLTQEASVERITRFIQRCAGGLPPTVFEKQDEEGPYTVITTVWNEEGRSYGVTTGGEVVKVPEGLKWAQGMAFDERLKIRPYESITEGISIYEKASDSPVIGFRAVDAFAPNRTAQLSAGKSGVVGEYYDEDLADVLAVFGKDSEELLPAKTENVLKRVYDGLGRKQPSVVYLNNLAASKVSRFSDALKILKDCLPSGSMLVVAADATVTGTVNLAVEDSVEMFTAADLSDNVQAAIDDRQYIRGSLI